jgi:hypothetical protein
MCSPRSREWLIKGFASLADVVLRKNEGYEKEEVKMDTK